MGEPVVRRPSSEMGTRNGVKQKTEADPSSIMAENSHLISKMPDAGDGFTEYLPSVACNLARYSAFRGHCRAVEAIVTAMLRICPRTLHVNCADQCPPSLSAFFWSYLKNNLKKGRRQLDKRRSMSLV